MAKKEVQVIAHRGDSSTAKFTVPFGTREEQVAAIAAKLRSGEDSLDCW
jgi:hypothetical protein